MSTRQARNVFLHHHSKRTVMPSRAGDIELGQWDAQDQNSSGVERVIWREWHEQNAHQRSATLTPSFTSLPSLYSYFITHYHLGILGREKHALAVWASMYLYHINFHMSSRIALYMQQIGRYWG